MTIKEAIASLIKKLKCKCKCASLCEVEVSGNDVVDAIERVMTPTQENNTTIVNNNTAVSSPIHSPVNSPRVLHRPLPRVPQTDNVYVAIV
jgi:hypothetical protein